MQIDLQERQFLQTSGCVYLIEIKYARMKYWVEMKHGSNEMLSLKETRLQWNTDLKGNMAPMKYWVERKHGSNEMLSLKETLLQWSYCQLKQGKGL